MAFDLTSQQRDDIMRLRREIVDEGEVNYRGGPSCGVTSEEVAALLGGQEFYGAYQTDHMGAPEHAWVVMADGTIVDPTADQFGGAPIELIPPGDPRRSRYLDQQGDDLADTDRCLSPHQANQEHRPVGRHESAAA